MSSLPPLASDDLFGPAGGIGTGLLLIDPSVVFDPTCHVRSFRVVVRPVDHAALFVPHVFAVEAYTVGFL
jgi:hypothetical protein